MQSEIPAGTKARTDPEAPPSQNSIEATVTACRCCSQPAAGVVPDGSSLCPDCASGGCSRAGCDQPVEGTAYAVIDGRPVPVPRCGDHLDDDVSLSLRPEVNTGP